MQKPFKIAIVGRPNVGKSRLFNRLSTEEKALWNNIAGLTRDRKEANASLGDLKFKIIDTAGFEENNKIKNSKESTILTQAQKQTILATNEADVILFLIDIRSGITKQDLEFAKILRKDSKKVILLGNKSDAKFDETNAYEAMKLGFGTPILISAEHNFGFSHLHDVLQEKMQEEEKIKEPEEKIEKLRISIVGRPNAGKSTLFNSIIGKERAIVSPIPGTTRDTISYEINVKDKNIYLFDTAGLRKSSKEKDEAEELSVSDTYRSIKYANTVILVVDALNGIEKQDLTIADHITSEGRSILVALNKWDLVEDKKLALEEAKYRLEVSFAQARNVPIIPISALEKTGVRALLENTLDVYESWNLDVSTSKLNKWLEDATIKNPPPSINGKRVKFKFIKQTSTRPPAFTIFTTSNLKGLSFSYIKYLVNHLSDYFNLQGTPIRLHIKKPKNPFEKDSDEVSLEV